MVYAVRGGPRDTVDFFVRWRFDLARDLSASVRKQSVTEYRSPRMDALPRADADSVSRCESNRHAPTNLDEFFTVNLGFARGPCTFEKPKLPAFLRTPFAILKLPLLLRPTTFNGCPSVCRRIYGDALQGGVN